MHASGDARDLDLLKHGRHRRVVPRDPRCRSGANEIERDIRRSIVGSENPRHGTRDAAVRCRVFRVVGRRHDRDPRRIDIGRGVAVGVGERDRRSRTPPLVEVLRVEARVARIVLRHPDHRHQPRLLSEAAAGGGEHAQVEFPVQRRRRGPEQRELALVCRPRGARRRRQRPRLVDIGGIRGARERRRRGYAELRVGGERERLDVGAVAVDRVEAAELAGACSRNIRR